MPALPSIASTANRRLLPTADLQIEGGTPAAFGAAIGEGLQKLGDAGQDFASSVNKFQVAKEAEANQAAEFDRQSQFINFGSAEDQRLTEAAHDISGSALGFTKDFMGSFDERAKQFIEAVPPKFKAQWQAKFGALRSTIAGAALKTEFGQRDAWSKTTTDDALTKLQNGITQSPDALDTYRAQGEELIDNSLLSPQDKLERKTQWKAQSALAAGLGDVQLDPSGALRRLGGVTPVMYSPTGTDASGSGPAATAPVKPNGALADNIVAGLQNRGLTPAQARGVAAGIAAESSNNVSAKNNDGGGEGAFGLGQWRGARLKALRAQYGPNPTGSQQLDFLVSELNGGDAGGKAVLSQSDEVAVLHHYVHDFMRPSATGAQVDMKNGLSALGRKVVEHAEATSARLRQPEPGKSYNVEDAIRELGYSPEQAQEFVKTGKPPAEATAAPPSDTQAAGSAPANELPAVDPRYAELPLSARMQLIDAAQRQIEHNHQISLQQSNDDHEAKVNGLLNDLNDGKAGLADIAAARQAGWLTDYSEVARAEGIVASKQKDTTDINNFQTMIHTPGFAFNQFDDTQQKAVDAGYANTVKYVSEHPGAEHTDPASIAFSIWNKTGIMPKQGAVMIRGALVSTDSRIVQSAASVASNMIEKNPNAFAGVDGGDDIERAALLYRHQIVDLGKTSEEAAQAVAAQNTPALRTKIAGNAEATAAFKKDLRATHIELNLGKDLGGIFRFNDPSFTSSEQAAAVRQDYAEIASDHFSQYGDANAAKSYAMAQLHKMYGVVDGRLMKYPPTKAYPAVNGSYDYIFRQAADDVKAATGNTVEPKSVYLMPLPTATAEAFRAGQKVPYAIHYIQDVDGQKVYQVLNGKAFVADPHVEQVKVSRERQRQFDQTRVVHQQQNTRLDGRAFPAMGG